MRSPIVPALVAAAALLATGAAHAQAEPKFGTRAIKECGAKIKSQPDTKQIEEQIRCNTEKKTRDYITLVENIKVETGKTRAYNQFNDGYATGIDTDAKVLPIRGSLVSYQCNPLVNDDGPYQKDNHGKNCMVVDQPRAEGKCYKTTFGDWWCNMQQNVDPSEFKHGQPPPR